MSNLKKRLEEQIENCQKIAATKSEEDRNGWLDDALYYSQIIDCIVKAEAEVQQCHAKATCCCGDYVKGHDAGHGHTPVSMYDYALDNAEADNARLVKAIAERNGEKLAAQTCAQSLALEKIDLEARIAELEEVLGELSDFTPWGGTDFSAFTKWVQTTALQALSGDGSAVADVLKAARDYFETTREAIYTGDLLLKDGRYTKELGDSMDKLHKALDRLPGGHDEQTG